MEFAYNSCRNRNCPKCQGDKRHEWIEKRLETTLAVPYYHTVFTVPNQLFEIGIYNQKIFYNILFKSASDTLKLFASDTKWWKMDEVSPSDAKPKIDLA
ncbi:MAG: transposase zinc-binding domain-containing protein, partial [Sulfurospirillum sp.]|nr:transposase zinc-binding domain-containing protein [Sulfurospirillum sp.]